MTEDLTSLEKDARELGEQLVYLLATADLPDDVKSAWLSLVPHMELEQLDRLMKALARYNVAPANEAFAGVADELKEIHAQHEKRVATADVAANASLDEIEKMIQQGE